jgi:hypothetical protein
MPEEMRVHNQPRRLLDDLAQLHAEGARRLRAAAAGRKEPGVGAVDQPRAVDFEIAIQDRHNVGGKLELERRFVFDLVGWYDKVDLAARAEPRDMALQIEAGQVFDPEWAHKQEREGHGGLHPEGFGDSAAIPPADLGR